MNTPSRLPLRASLIVLCSWYLLPGSLFAQGALTPPGAPAPTMKTLDQLDAKLDAKLESRIAINATNTPGDAISLFKITQPGSYFLTGNIIGISGKHGIAIASSGVSLDLNGFDLVGVPGSLDGVSATVFDLTNIAVINGSVRSWGGDGVDLRTNFTRNSRVVDVQATENGGSGIRVHFGCTVLNCSAAGNSAGGIAANASCMISNSLALQNTGAGITTIAGCTVLHCSASSNLGSGFAIGDGCTVSNCVAESNNNAGFTVAFGCTVTHSATHQNTGDGMDIGGGCTILNCSAYQNFGYGILTNNSCVVADCTAKSNTLDGIICVASCLIRGNVCSSNGSVSSVGGIHATGGQNRIEGNTCTSSGRGVTVDVAGNFIIKNTCSGNTTDWVLAAGNVFGPIVDRRSFLSSTVNGFSATSTLGTTEPNANFSY